jgi:hypothetical protein
MKRILLLVLLIALTLVELFLCTAFLPISWQQALNNRVAGVLSWPADMTSTTHPLFSAEIDQVLRKNLALRIFVWAVILGLLVVNTLAIRFVWRRFHAAITSGGSVNQT